VNFTHWLILPGSVLPGSVLPVPDVVAAIDGGSVSGVLLGGLGVTAKSEHIIIIKYMGCSI
jgi:hypothetical protein